MAANPFRSLLVIPEAWSAGRTKGGYVFEAKLTACQERSHYFAGHVGGTME
jgi:hypothetical protein